MGKKENIITIDGPAGSGKSTIAKILARELNMRYVDTGAMYRAVTLIAIENNIDLENEEEILKRIRDINIELDNTASDENKYTKIRLNGRDVTDKIRSKEVGGAVSVVSKLSKIRKYLVRLQRKIANEGNAVLEGRDTGSVVCPNAVLKIFLTASIKERIKRRSLQVERKGQRLSEKIIKEEIISRDKIDSGRKDSPLVIPEEGIEIDTTKMSIDQVVGKIKNIYLKRINDKNKA